MEPTLGALAPYLIAIAVLSIVMVYAMVQWSRALLLAPGRKASRAPLAPRGLSPAARWGWIHAAIWAALILAFLRLFAVLGEGRTRRNLLLLLLVTAAWFGVHAALLAFLRALARTGRPVAGTAEQGETGEVTGDPGTAAETSEADGMDRPGEKPEQSGFPRQFRDVLGHISRLVGTLVLVFLAIAAGELIPPLKALEAYLVARRTAYVVPLAIVTGLGWILFMACIIHLVLTSGRRLSRRDSDALSGRVRLTSSRPALFRRSAYRSSGVTAGAAAEDSASFAEVKRAWRERAWRTSQRWRRMFLLMAGAALMTCGLVGLVVVLAPAGLKLVFAAALLYAAIQTARGFARA